jgi:hypothetical protein
VGATSFLFFLSSGWMRHKSIIRFCVSHIRCSMVYPDGEAVKS